MMADTSANSKPPCAHPLVRSTESPFLMHSHYCTESAAIIDIPAVQSSDCESASQLPKLIWC